MKRLLLLLALCLVMVVPVMALTETFQSWDGFSQFSASKTGACTGGISVIPPGATGDLNVYQYCYAAYLASGNTYMINLAPTPFTYAAFDVDSMGYYNGGWYYDSTHPAPGFGYILYDSGGSAISSYWDTTIPPYSRYEIKIIGGTPTLFKAGVQVATSTPVSVNPSYMSIWMHLDNGNYGIARDGGMVYTDNVLIGESDHHLIGGLPSNWSIHHDFINPASDGVYAWNPNTNAWVLKNSNFFYIDADKEFGSVADPSPETLQIAKMSTGTIVNSTVVSYTHNQVQYDLAQFLATSGVTSGQYSVGFEGSTVKDYFWVIEDGGFISFNKSTYNLGETGTLSWYLTASYIDLSTYTYTYEIVDVFGNVKSSGITATTPTDTSGQVQITFSDTTYDQGAYYAEMIATNKLTAEEHILGATAFTLTDHVEFQGYVHNAENETAISGVNISVTQSGYVSNTLSGFNGNYTSNATFVTGYPMTFNVTKTGYRQYTNTFTPLVGGTHALNLTLIPTAPTCVGVCIGGFVKDNVYGNPISDANVSVRNVTTAYNLTNRVGYYRVDNLVADTLYDVWSTKTGFGNSTVAQKLAVGA